MITDYHYFDCVECGAEAIVIEQRQYYCPKCWLKLFTKVYDNDKIKNCKSISVSKADPIQGRSGRGVLQRPVCEGD